MAMMLQRVQSVSAFWYSDEARQAEITVGRQYINHGSGLVQSRRPRRRASTSSYLKRSDHESWVIIPKLWLLKTAKDVMEK